MYLEKEKSSVSSHQVSGACPAMGRRNQMDHEDLLQTSNSWALSLSHT